MITQHALSKWILSCIYSKSTSHLYSSLPTIATKHSLNNIGNVFKS